MFNPFTWLDRVLLGALQKFCDKFQRLTGLTKFRLTKLAVIMMTSFFLTSLLFWTGTFDRVLVCLLLVIATASIVFQIELQEQMFLEYGPDSLPLPFNGVIGRIVWLVFYGFFTAMLFVDPFDFESTMLVCGNVSYVLFIYFDSCLPCPPSKSKAREWCEKALMWLNDRLKPSPMPTN